MKLKQHPCPLSKPWTGAPRSPTRSRSVAGSSQDPVLLWEAEARELGGGGWDRPSSPPRASAQQTPLSVSLGSLIHSLTQNQWNIPQNPDWARTCLAAHSLVSPPSPSLVFPGIWLKTESVRFPLCSEPQLDSCRTQGKSRVLAVAHGPRDQPPCLLPSAAALCPVLTQLPSCGPASGPLHRRSQDAVPQPLTSFPSPSRRHLHPPAPRSPSAHLLSCDTANTSLARLGYSL